MTQLPKKFGFTFRSVSVVSNCNDPFLFYSPVLLRRRLKTLKHQYCEAELKSGKRGACFPKCVPDTGEAIQTDGYQGFN